MNRIGRVFAALVLVGMFIPALAAPASAQKCYPSCVPTILVGPTDPSAGDEVVVSGAGWCPSSTVEIFLDGVSMGTAAGGHFSTTITIPPGTAPGPHTITVTGLDSSCQNPQTVSRTIMVIGGGQQGGNLPFTGSNISAGMLILFALVTVGAASLVAGRRRDAQTQE